MQIAGETVTAGLVGETTSRIAKRYEPEHPALAAGIRWAGTVGVGLLAVDTALRAELAVRRTVQLAEETGLGEEAAGKIISTATLTRF